MEKLKQSRCNKCINNDSTNLYIIVNGVWCKKKKRTIRTLPMNKKECKDFIPYDNQKKIGEMEKWLD